MIGKHQIIPRYNRKPRICIYNLAIFLPGSTWDYHYKNLASQTGISQSGTSGYTLNSLGQDSFAKWPLYLRSSDSA